MTQPSLSTRNSGLRVFNAGLLSALLIMMPFVQLAAGSRRESAENNRGPETARQATDNREETAAAPENVFANAPIPKSAPEPLVGPVIVATKDDGLATVATVAPGGTINYSVNIKNNGTVSPTDDATGVTFTDIIDSHTTLVVSSAVAAVSDRYNAIGNVLLTIPDGSTDLLANDIDPDTGNNTGMTVTAETKSSTSCTGGCSNNVTINADGSFTYDPPVGFSGTDTFTYTAHSTVGTGTATETVTITVANEIWFINNNAGACPGAPCDGRLSHPFTTLAAFTAANLGGAGQPGDNDWIFIYESAADYAGPATLRNGQRFIGQDATASLATLTGFPAPSGTDPLPVMNSANGTFVNITGANVNGINLLSGNTLRGFRVGNVGTGTKISGTSFGTLVVGNSGSPDVLLHGTGRALNLTTGTLSNTGGFTSVTTTSSATQGISLSGVADSDGAGAGSFSFGSTTVSGSTTQGILISTTPADLNFGATSVTGGTNGISFQNNSGGTRTFVTLGISGSANEAFLHGTGGGNVTVTSTATLSSAGSAISVSAPAATNAINFQAATSATSTGAGITAVNWAGAANTSMTFNSLSITRNNGTALNASGGGTINVTNASGSITNTTPGGPAIIAANIALNANFSQINSSAGANGVSLTSVTGTSNLGTGQLTGTVSGATFLVNSGTTSVTYSGNITQAAAAPMVSIIDHATGTILFQTGTLSATLGTGIALDNADGTYNFSGTNTLNGGNAHIDIIDGAAGTISFSSNTAVTNPSGVAVNVDGSGVLNPVTAGITIAGSLSKTSGGRLIDFNDYDTGTATISATLSCITSCDGIEITNDGTASGIVNLTSATKTLNTGADNAVQLDNNDSGQINFTGGSLDIDTTTGIGFNAINGGTVTVTGSANSINSVSAAALTVTSTNIGANEVTFERIDSGNNNANPDPVSGIILNSTGTAGGLNVIGSGTTDGSGGTIQSTTGDGIALTSTSSVVLKNMIIGDNAAVHTEAVSSTNNIGDDGIASTTVTPVAGDTYGLDIDNLKIARTAGGGIDGAGGGNVGLHVNNTEIINPGDVGTPSSTSSDEDAIGYGSGFAGNADQLTGTALIENSTFAAFIDHGIQMENSGSGTLNMTVSNVIMKNNDGLTLCSGGPCEGSAIQVIADGSTVAGGAGPTISLTVRQLTVTNIDQDGIDAIADPGGNINVTVGDPANNATNGITFNCPNGDQVLRFNSGSPDSDDVATFNFNVRNVIVSNSPGTLVIFKAANAMTGKFINSTLDQNNATANTLASRGIEITADGDASGGANEAPAMTILIDNVTLNRIGGDGIQAFMTDVTNASSRLDLTIQNCNIGTNPANTAQTGLEVGLNNSLASEGIEIRNGVTTTNNGQLYLHLLNNNIRNATSLSGSADGIDIDTEFLSTSHVTVVNNDIFAAPGTTDYDLAVEANTAFMCADFTGNTDSNDANAGADITNNGDAADFQIEGGSGSLAGSNPAITPFNFTGTFTTGTCTMPNTPSGAFFALNNHNQSNQQIYVASLATQVANDLPADIFASAENALTIATLPAAPATVTQPSLVTQVANVVAHSASEVHSLISSSAHQEAAVSSQRSEVTDQRSEIRTHHAPSSKLETRNTTSDEETGLRAHYAVLSKLATRNATAAPAPMSGETVTANIGTLPAGGSVTLTFQVQVNTPPNLTLLSPPRVENQGTVSGGNFVSVLTDDPNVVGAADKTATRIDLFDTTTSLVSDINPSNDAEQVTFTATINETPVQGSADPTGTVDFIDTSNGNAVICNDVAVAAGSAQCQVSNLSAGSTHNIRADYSGDGNFDPSQSNLVAQVVNACSINPVVTKIADTNDGVCDADCSLREAIATVCSAPNNNITFDTAGVFATPQTITLTSELVVGKNLTINAPDAAANHVTVSGGGVTRVFKINPGKSVTLRDFTVSGGSVTGNGGGILNDHAVLVLLKMTISGNTATASGGGMFSDGAGGTATLNIIQSTISGNTATTNGGGISNDGTGGTANLTITNSTLSGNNAAESGGGLYDTGTLTVYNSTFTENRADNDNNATGTGGGIFRGAGTGIIHNTIVAGNFNEDGVTDSRDDVSGALFSSSSFNLIGDGTGLTGGMVHGTDGNQIGTGVLPIDAMLGPLANNGGPTFTHALLPGSPAIEAGSNAISDGAGLTEDQRDTGYPRKADSADVDTIQTVDIGAFELHPSIENVADTSTNEDTAKLVVFNLGDDTGALITGGSVTATSSNGAVVTSDLAHLSFTGSGGSRTLTITPNTDASGVTTITITVTATNGRTATDTFDLTVNAQNDNPTITNNTGHTVNEASTGNVIDNTKLKVDDVDNTTAQVTFTVGTAPVNGTLKNNGVGLSSGGTFTQADIDGGLLTYDHDGSETTSDGFTFTVSDGAGGTISSTAFNITVTPQNDNPTLSNNTGTTVNEGSTANTITNAMLSVSDVDNTAAQITFTVGTAPANGTLKKSGVGLAGGGTFTQADINGNLLTYDHNGTETTSDSFTFTVSDGAGGSIGSTAFNITVTLQNDVPSITNNTGTTVNEGSSGNVIDNTKLKVDDGDNTAAQITFTLGTAPANGTLKKSGIGMASGGTFTQADIDGNLLTYDHDGSETTSDGFTFTVSDGVGGTIGSTAFNITVTPQNDNPTLTTNAGLSVLSAGTGTIDNTKLKVDDPDNTAAQLTFTVGTTTTNGTLKKGVATLSAGGTFTQADIDGNQITYTHNGTATTTDSFTFTVSDGAGGSIGSTTFNITIGNPNLSINNAKVPEPASPNTVDMTFTVSLATPAGVSGASVNFQTNDGSANAGTCGNPGADYVSSSGTVNFLAGQQVKTINVPVCSDAVADDGETFTVTLSSPVNATIVNGTATGTITGNTPGTLVISELRTSGPGGAGDDFVELYNNTNSPLTVAASDASAGYGVYKMGADCNATPILIGVIPNGTVIPARGHFLLVGSAYSLGNYGGSGAAAGNLTFSADIESDANVGLFTTSDVTAVSSANRLDAVGFGINTGGACNLLREGSTLPPMAGSTLEYSYFRKMCDWIQGSGCTVPGVPKDSNNNSDDFWLADTTGSAITGRLGAPGPENIASPIRRDNANNPGSGGINVALLDGMVGSASHPNRARNGGDPVGTFGSMTLRYRVTNNTGVPVTRLRYRVVDISTAIQPAGPTADLRALTGIDEDGGVGNDPLVTPVNDTVTCTSQGSGTPCTVTVRATTLETPPSQTIGGGYNSTLSSGTISTGTPLPNGQSILINFKLGVQKTGTFRFYIIVEALP